MKNNIKKLEQKIKDRKEHFFETEVSDFESEKRSLLSLLKYDKPVTPGRRGVVKIKKDHLWKGGPVRFLTSKLKNHGGRNNQGVITCQGRIDPFKRKYRMVDFDRQEDFRGEVVRIEYDPNRSAHIALIRSEENTYKYILASESMRPGMKVGSGSKADRLEGHSLKLLDINVGSKIHNIELQPKKGGQIVRSAGAFAILVSKQEGFANIKLPSKEVRKFSLECMATIGAVSNMAQLHEKLGKAGRGLFVRKRRSKVRGVAKNPVDHCNGGKTSGGKVFRNSIGNMIKGKKTRSKNKFSNSFIIERRNKAKQGKSGKAKSKSKKGGKNA